MATIARVARVCRSKAFQAIKHLEALGYLKRTRALPRRWRSDFKRLSTLSIEAKRYPPVAQKDTPCHPDKLPPVHPVDTNYIQSEQDPREGGTPARSTELSSASAPPPSLSQPRRRR